jgi:hypothetical protein
MAMAHFGCVLSLSYAASWTYYAALDFFFCRVLSDKPFLRTVRQQAPCCFKLVLFAGFASHILSLSSMNCFHYETKIGK